jgi:hypothetical protein
VQNHLSSAMAKLPIEVNPVDGLDCNSDLLYKKQEQPSMLKIRLKKLKSRSYN